MPLSATRVLRTFPKAMYFDGIDDYVSIPDSQSLRWGYNPFTIMFWYKETTVGAQDIMRHAGLVKTGYWSLSFITSTSELLFVTRSSDTNEYFIILMTARPSNWACVALTRQDPTWTFYLNGSFNSQKTDTRTGRGMDFAGIYIGRLLFVSHFNGLISNVLIYNRALSQTEIQYNYQNPDNPIRNGLVLWLSYDSVSGSTWYDKSGNNINGTIYGATLQNVIKQHTRLLTPTRILVPRR